MSRDVYDGGAWDIIPPGAEEDYAASHSSHGAHYPPPPHYTATRHKERRDRDTRHEPGRYDRHQRRSRSYSRSPERDRKRSVGRRPPRRRHSPSVSPARFRCSSISSDSDRSLPSRPRRPISPTQRSDVHSHRGGSSPEPVRRHRAPSFTPPKSYKPRATSKSSSSSRSTSSSSFRSRSRSRSSSSSSRSSSPRTTKKRRSLSRSRSRGTSKHSISLRHTSKSHRSMSQKCGKSLRRSASSRRGASSKQSGSPRRSASPRQSASPMRSRSSSRHSDSSSSSRGRFSGYDRKRYFRKLKEKEAKEREIKEQKDELEAQLKEEVSPAAPVITDEDTIALEYRGPPPVDGINFEDLPPPPEELAGISGLLRRPVPPVCIRNDGSFLEMFKKLQEEKQQAEASTAPAPTLRKPVPPFIGKRRGGRVLKTGVVQKVKVKEETTDAAPKDAWSLYMQEVKKYRETSCEEERKTRPLVK